MGYVLCTAEKPSVALEIANVLGNSKKYNGYYECNYNNKIYRVTWAVGHLVGLAPPEAYGYMSLTDMWDKSNPDNKNIALQQLPLIPDNFKLVVLEPTRPQFEIIKSLMNDDNCEYIIDCGDAGPEGHILQWFIRIKAGCRKTVKRFMATSMTKEAILDAFNNLEDVEKYLPVVKGEYCKKKADWIMGMSISRAASIVYNAKIDVGRVLSPTLYFIVKRYIDVKNFKSMDFYTFTAHMKGFDVNWMKDSTGLFKSSNGDVDERGRLINKELANKIFDELNMLSSGTVSRFDTVKRATDRPQLYDITELERDGIRHFGYTADEVLAIAQSLYETHKITTYPRTDSRYITTDLVPYMEDRIHDICSIPKFTDVAKSLLDNKLLIDKRVANDSKVTDHHAIITTSNLSGFNLANLSEKEMNILNLIITRMLVAFSGKFKYNETIVNISFSNGMVFSATGKIPVDYGWKKVLNSLNMKETEEGESDSNMFPCLQLNQVITLDSVSLVPKKTSPPLLHTEATLLTAMENAGNGIEGGEIIKGKGIGTQATRAAIIKNLFDKNYVVNDKKGKTNYLIPTNSGISVIKVLPPELYSPKITADWENQIYSIVEGNSTDHDFMDNFKAFITSEVSKVTNNIVDGVDFSLSKQAFAKCPWCGSDVFEGELVDKNSGKPFKNLYCCNKECKFGLRKDNIVFKSRTGKNMTDKQLQKLISNKKLEYTGISKSGNKYKGLILLKSNDKGYANLEFTFAHSKTSNIKKSKIF